MAQVVVNNTALSFAYPKIESDDKWTLDASKLKPEVVDYLFAYGAKQAVADRCSGLKPESGESDEKFAARVKACVGETLKALLDGSIRMGGGGGGARLSPLERHCREVFVEQLVRQGSKVGDAREMQTEWRKVILDRQLDKARTTGGDEAAARKNAEAIVASITAEAQARVDRDAKVKIDI